jgi:chemotaxis signal transduction protein
MTNELELPAIERPAHALLLFRVGTEFFALDLASVDEALEVAAIVGVPSRERHLLGVIDWRGMLLPVYSPSRALGLEIAGGGVTLVVRDRERCIGLAVDDVCDVLQLREEEIRPAPVRGTREPIMRGLVRKDDTLVAVLDAGVLVRECAMLGGHA